MSSHNRQYWAEEEAQARAIVNALGAGWALVDRSGTPDEWHSWHLQRQADGFEVDLAWTDAYERQRGKPCRLTLRACWPRDHTRNIVVPSQTERKGLRTEISVDATKSPTAIAIEADRRLIQPFRPYFERALAIVASRQSYGDQTEDTLRAIESATGGRRSSNSKETVYLGEPYYAYTVRAEGEGVRFEAFSCPRGVALQVLAVLRKAASTREDDAEEAIGAEVEA